MSAQFRAHLIAYHRDYAFFDPKDYAAVVFSIDQPPFVSRLLSRSTEPIIPMKRFTMRDDVREWRFKVGLPIDLFNCDWDADVANGELLFNAMRDEVEQFSAVEARLPRSDYWPNMSEKLLWATKRQRKSKNE